MSRPENTKLESIMSVADAAVWAIINYGMFGNSATTARPENTKLESIKSVNDVIAWLVS